MKNVALTLARALTSRGLLGLVLLAALVLLRVWDPDWLEETRLRSFDLYQRISPRAYSVSPVIIVDIDEESLRLNGQWPWPRLLLANILNRLYEWQVAAVAFDVVFAEPDRLSPDEALKILRQLDPRMSDPRIAELLSSLPSYDAVFAKAIAEGKVVLGQAGTQFGPAIKGTFPETEIVTMGSDLRPYLFGFPHLLRNIPALEQAAKGRGVFSILPERDGIVRRVPIVMKAGEQIVPSLTLEMLRVVTGSSTISVRSDEAGVRTIAVPGLDELPTDQNGRIWVHYTRHEKGRYVSAKDILEGKASPERFAGKLALVGTSAIGLLDIKTTPVSQAIPGVEVHTQL